MNQKIIIESLSMDLLRVALGLHRGSFKMAKRFKEEALERYKDLGYDSLKDNYLKSILEKVKQVLESEKQGKEEDLLMYSTLFQNYARKYFQIK